jgi:hypothetical protein
MLIDLDMKKAIYLIVVMVGFVFAKASATAIHYTKGENKVVAVKDTTNDDSDTTDDDLNRMFAFGLEYASDQTQYGLHNNVKIPYLEPNFTYTAPKGFYITLSEQYLLPKKVAGFDAFCINPGWDIDLGDYTSLDFSYTHYSFPAKSPNFIKSSLSNSLEGYFEQWIGKLRGKFSVAYDIYKQKTTPNDVIFTPDLMYKFKWKLNKKTTLKIKPEFSMDFGTRNYYTQYINAKKADSTAKKIKPKTTPVSSTANSSFGALDYNIVIPLDFAIGKFDLEPSFTYTNPLYAPSNLPNPPTAYFTFSVCYTISTK